MTTSSSSSISQSPVSSGLESAADGRPALNMALQGPGRLLDCLSNPELDLASRVDCLAAVIVVGSEPVNLLGDGAREALGILPALREAAVSGVCYSGMPEADSLSHVHVLAVHFCPPEDGWLLWFRDAPAKPETAWSDTDLATVTALRADLLEACLHRATLTNRVQQRLISRLGHDLCNPLQSITMSAGLLRPQGERDTELTRHIVAAGKKMDRLLAQVRDLNQLQAGNAISINPVETNISALVQAVLEDEQALYPELSIQAQIEPGITAMVDADRYAEVIAHLLNNASQQSKPDTPTLIELQKQEDSSTLTISCQVDPLSPEQLAGLFQPVTSDGPISEQSGLGMGLYTCAAIVQAHEGSVGAEQAEESIVFCLTLPLLES